MKTFIRPVHDENHEGIPMSLALCRTNAVCTVDGDILDHFDSHEPGIEIKAVAKDFYGSDDCQWGNPINVTGAVTPRVSHREAPGNCSIHREKHVAPR